MRTHFRLPNDSKTQQGVALIISLVMLLTITLIAISGMTSSLMQEKMAANAQNSTKTFQAAESAVGALSGKLTGGDISSLQEAMTEASKYSKAVAFSINDSKVAAQFQTRYLGEVIITSGDSMDGDESSTLLKGYRFELIGAASIDAVQAYSRIFQGIEYH
ncbi:MAG: PilX protein [Hahellaceae bacterium]|nr:PilX protein [Hahellaceae bacterium]MCP5170035.1 PilX protein [Hahellaceae bacterium]